MSGYYKAILNMFPRLEENNLLKTRLIVEIAKLDPEIVCKAATNVDGLYIDNAFLEKEKIRELVAKDQKINAIKLHRKAFKSTLQDAKKYVDFLYESLPNGVR